MAPFKVIAGRHKGRFPRNPAFAVALSVLAALLFCWPFVHVPRLSLWHAYLHLFGSWAAVNVALWWMSRCQGRQTEEQGGRDD
jgi:hypothetical protein